MFVAALLAGYHGTALSASLETGKAVPSATYAKEDQVAEGASLCQIPRSSNDCIYVRGLRDLKLIDQRVRKNLLGIDAEVTAVLLARGFLDLQDQAVSNGSAIHQDASMPPAARRALALLSGLCLEGGQPDMGSSVHEAMDLACRPMSDWHLPQLQKPFKYAEVVLIDGDLGVPTDDCRELAREGGSEIAAHEERRHKKLRAAVAGYPSILRNKAYTSIREFVVRNPAAEYDAIAGFIAMNGHVAAAQAIMSFYRHLPQAALFDGVARRCGHCGSLLWPDRDVAAFPVGRCRIRQCRLANPHQVRGVDVINPADWMSAQPDVLAFWVGPGLDEIKIYDALKTAGRTVVLYPHADAADVGVDGLGIGIDVKTYASPIALAAKLSRSIGRLEMFARKLLVVPDDKLRLNPRYIEQMKAAYDGAASLEFTTTSALIAELST